MASKSDFTTPHHNSIFDAEIDDRYIAPVHIAMAIEMKLREVYVFAIVDFLSCISVGS